MRRKMIFCLFFLGSLILNQTIKSSDFIEVLPVTDSIIMLHLDDGYLQLPTFPPGGDAVFVDSPLDVDLAGQTTSYYISSLDDADYTKALTPLSVGRKSKPMDIDDFCVWEAPKCKNEYALEHWIYLALPAALEQGKTYKVYLGNLVENVDEVEFTYDVYSSRSEAIHVNQMGFRPNARMKYAYVAHWMGSLGSLPIQQYEGNNCYLVDIKNQTAPVAVGTLQPRKLLTDNQNDNGNMGAWGPFNNFFGSDVYEVDFSSFNTPGEYVLAIEGIGCSFPFKIEDDIYREAFHNVARSLYHQRAGIALEQPYTRFTRGRDHHPDDGQVVKYAATVRSIEMGENSGLYDETVNNATETLPNCWGWYHDAGDWDGYMHHWKVPKALLGLYQIAPSKFTDGELNIPESGNGIPDIVDEAAWLIQYYRRNIRPNGGVCGGRVHSDMNDKPDNVTSAGDTRTWYAGAEDPHTSYTFAGLAALYAYTLESIGISDSTAKLLAEAEAAYSFAKNNTLPGDNDLKVDGEYLDDMQLYAAVCLFKLTGEQQYFDDIQLVNKVTDATKGLNGNDYKQQWAGWVYMTIPDDSLTIPNSLELKGYYETAAVNLGKDIVVNSAKKRSARVGYNFYKPPIIGATTTPDVMEGVFGQYAATGTDKEELEDYVQTTCDYFLGGNPSNIMWISGVGDRSPERFLHLDSRYDHQVEFFQGYIPYGPNKQGDMFGGEDDMGPWDADFAKKRCYPGVDEWPVSEWWFDSPYSVIDHEFTLWQTMTPATIAYGFLCDGTSSLNLNGLPQVSLVDPSGDLTLNEMDTLEIAVTTSDDEWIRKVEYFLDHQKISETTTDPFSDTVLVTGLPAGTFSLYGIATDNEGKTSYSDSVMVTISKDYVPTITSPLETDAFIEGDTVDVAIDVQAITGVTIDSVQVYLNGMLVMTDNDGQPFDLKIEGLLARKNEIKTVLHFAEGFTSSATRAVFADPAVKGIEIADTLFEARVGEYHVVIPNIIPDDAYNKAYSWSVGDETIAGFLDSALFEVLKEGETMLYATTEQGGYVDSIRVVALPAYPAGPYGGEPWIVPGKIEFENYDHGGNNVAYHDNTPGNSENAYRFESVDIESTFDLGSGAYAITNVSAGEWVTYSIIANETNLYDFTFRITCGVDNARLSILVDDEYVAENIAVSNVGWWPYADFLVEDVLIMEGEHTLEIQFDNPPYTLNYIEITCPECTKIPVSGVQVDKKFLNLYVGSKTNLNAIISPDDASDKSVFWKSLNDTIVFVSPTGEVSALDTGEVKVFVKTASKGFTDTSFVKVYDTSATITGINYEYYEGEWDFLPDYSTLTPSKVGTVTNFDLSVAEQGDNFSIRYSGFIDIKTAGDYVFYTTSDDGSALYINGTKVVDNDGAHAAVTESGTINLTEGIHSITVAFFEKGGGEVLDVEYAGPSISKQLIPDSVLSSILPAGDLVTLTGIDIVEESITMLPASYQVPEVTFTPADASDKKLVWQSLDSNVAYADEYGVIRAMNEGTVKVIATSREGGYSDTLEVVVFNQDPVVSITNPLNDESYYADTTLQITATATDDGDVVKVSFYQNNTLLGVSYFEPHVYEWANIPAGSYTIHAEAQDNNAATGVSSNVQIEVIEKPIVESVDEVSGSPLVEIFPVPADDVINISSTRGLFIHLTDVTGKVLLTKQLKTQHSIDCSGWVPGVYVYKLYNSSRMKELQGEGKILISR